MATKKCKPKAKPAYTKYRSSKTGRFVSAAFARRHPATTQGIG